VSVLESSTRDIPPPIDLSGHLRDLARVIIPALAITLIVAGAVFGLRTTLAPKEYSATIVTRIMPGGDVVPGDAFVEQLRAPFVGLTHDVNVLNQVLSSVDTGWDAATLDTHITTTPGPAPNVLTFTATAGSPDLAEQIVRSVVVNVGQAAVANHNRDTARQVDQLRAAIAAEQARNDAIDAEDPEKSGSNRQLADLQAQLQRVEGTGSDQLTVLATPEQDPAPISPRPFEEAVVAGFATLIVVSELLVWWRRRVGRKPNVMWARRVAGKYGAHFDPADQMKRGLPALAASAAAHSVRNGRHVLVLLGNNAALSESAVLPNTSAGDDRAVTPGAIVSRELRSTWWRDVDTSTIGTVIVVLSVKAQDRRVADRTLRQLRDLFLPTYLVLQRPRKATGEVTSEDDATEALVSSGDASGGHAD
jgi:capsular polysaccharide biosynthesis protein